MTNTQTIELTIDQQTLFDTAIRQLLGVEERTYRRAVKAGVRAEEEAMLAAEQRIADLKVLMRMMERAATMSVTLLS